MILDISPNTNSVLSLSHHLFYEDPQLYEHNY